MKQFWKKILAFFKKEDRKRIGKKYNYHHYKDQPVKMVQSGKKVLLRKYISHLANKLHDLNFKGPKVNRMALIKEFEHDNLPGVNKYYKEQVEQFIKQQKTA